MDKPKKKVSKAHYDYHDIIKFVEDKYNIQTRGYKEEVDGIYRDFWHWMIEHNDVHNGCYISFPEDWRVPEGDDITPENLEYHDKYAPTWVREIMEMIVKEFPGIEREEIWVSW